MGARRCAFTVFSLVRLGVPDEATAFIEWLAKRIREETGAQGPLNTMYSIDGVSDLPEFALDHLQMSIVIRVRFAGRQRRFRVNFHNWICLWGR